MKNHSFHGRWVGFVEIMVPGFSRTELRPVHLSPERLAAELVKGWQYLVDSDPRVLAWLMDYQRLHFEFERYPTSGTPVVPAARA